MIALTTIIVDDGEAAFTWELTTTKEHPKEIDAKAAKKEYKKEVEA